MPDTITCCAPVAGGTRTCRNPAYGYADPAETHPYCYIASHKLAVEAAYAEDATAHPAPEPEPEPEPEPAPEPAPEPEPEPAPAPATGPTTHTPLCALCASGDVSFNESRGYTAEGGLRRIWCCGDCGASFQTVEF